MAEQNAVRNKQAQGRAPATRRARPESIYQLKVTLKHIRPPIWRRIQVADNTPLSKLHHILQFAFGWWEGHLHEFTARGEHYGPPDPEDWEEVRSEQRATLRQVAPVVKSRFVYQYDFGDDWEHEILVEKILPPEPEVRYPVCIAGKRSAPPEDSGGPWRYGFFLKAISDPEDPEHDEMLEWVGGEFDAERFDIETINARLRTLR